jgi:hypothetical protein
VATSGNTIIAGADDSEFIFERDQGSTNNWGQVKKLLISSRDNGLSVTISGNLITIGAGQTRIDSNFNQGAAYLYKSDAGGTNNWGQVRRFLASDGAAQNYFGDSAAISGNTMVVGAPSDDVDTTIDRGSAYIFNY